jgi:hypothetical protein
MNRLSTGLRKCYRPSVMAIDNCRNPHKVRQGGMTHRRCDEPQTPYQRLMDSGQLSARAMKLIRQQYEAWDVAEYTARSSNY